MNPTLRSLAGIATVLILGLGLASCNENEKPQPPAAQQPRGFLQSLQQGQVTYFGGRKPEDGEIDWAWPARRIYDLVRAVTHPYPGAFTVHDGRRLFVWWGRPEDDRVGLEPGQLDVSSSALRVGTGRGALRLERVQIEGEKEREAREWAAAAAVRSGDRLGPST